MSSVLPIDTQRYQSGNYTLEVMAHASSLSQWSDRPVVRQLRFSLWSEQPERQQLAVGNQLQLMTLSNAVETYVQTHLSQQAWPQQTHSIKLLDKDLAFSTLQLFDLAEVLNACGQRQVILPVAVAQRRQPRRRRQWWTGSAAASLLVAVGVTTAYLHYRPAAFNEVATTQAPEAVFDDAVEESTSGANAIPEGNSPPLTAPAREERAAADSVESSEDINAQESQELVQQPLNSEELESVRVTRLPAESPEPSADVSDAAPPTGVAQAPGRAFPEFDTIPEAIIKDAPAPPSQPAPAETSPATETPLTVEEQESLGSADFSAASRIERRSQPSTDHAANVVDGEEILREIATQLAPYEPADATYPLTYHIQIAADGTILNLEPISPNAPILNIPTDVIHLTPGRLLQLELIYTGADQPIVQER
ncbi:DUF4335 domain-containing protein [Leptolyngbyaceae cyanobacterium CCMR0082]|uniref:DUF4335 domain-containing protein n=1 Tax=Adonisia turfae CCMR0082 TaxID=2304604 RepID=A0A6M0S832_9CYAN|nr:DUF4335 domain-containing protein [Adonisia turfae]NEZ64111.1 DUF4335 domain-containing protein [Adonisia turfae CCMR0082]